ncbi:MAG: PD-(D/E)XK nuclease domain-containing protein, partial [Erysipelotrichaceae bacterium]
ARNARVTLCIEIKKAEELSLLEQSAEEAINQIRDKKYVEGLKSKGHRNIKAYGIAFFDKSCCIKKVI